LEILKDYEDEFSTKRQKGVYKTPFKTALHMANIVNKFITKDSIILDPCVGDGVFIDALLEIGVNPENISAHDINYDVVEHVKKLGITCIQKDSLLEDFNKKDIIIGNPPYKSRRNNNYLKQNKSELNRKYKSIGLYNLYSLFMYNSIIHLKNNGILCFIVEDAFLTNRYYNRFRKFILDTCKIIEIKLAPWRLFHGSKADVRTTIITLQKKPEFIYFENKDLEKTHIMRLVDRLANENEYNDPPSMQMVPQYEYRLMPDLKYFIGVPKFIYKLVQHCEIRFGDIAKGGTGISTGNDKKYLRSAKIKKDDENWVGFYKSGSKNPYYYSTEFYIERDYLKKCIKF